MNRLPLLLLLLLLPGIQGLAQNTSSPSKKPDWSAFRKDTLYNRATVFAYTSLKRTVPLSLIDTAYLNEDPANVIKYVRQSDIISFFEPYLLKETIPPGDVKNSVYKRHMKKEALVLKHAKAGLQKWLSDTSFFEVNTKYQLNQQILDTLKPYFVANLCKPGDTKHPAYIRFVNQGKNLEDQVIDSLLKRLPAHPAWANEISKRLSAISELKSCEVKLIPVYYLTPNVAQYQKGQNIAKYFTLDTSSFKFTILKNNRLIAVVKYNSGFWQVYEQLPGDIPSYERVLSLNKDPIGFFTYIRIKPQGVSISNFGYLSADRAIVAECFNSQRAYSLDSEPGIIHQKFDNGCTIQSAESYLTGPTSVPNILQLRLKTAYDYVLRYRD